MPGLSADPEKRALQLDALARGRVTQARATLATIDAAAENPGAQQAAPAAAPPASAAGPAGIPVMAYPEQEARPREQQQQQAPAPEPEQLDAEPGPEPEPEPGRRGPLSRFADGFRAGY